MRHRRLFDVRRYTAGRWQVMPVLSEIDSRRRRGGAWRASMAYPQHLRIRRLNAPSSNRNAKNRPLRSPWPRGVDPQVVFRLTGGLKAINRFTVSWVKVSDVRICESPSRRIFHVREGVSQRYDFHVDRAWPELTRGGPAPDNRSASPESHHLLSKPSRVSIYSRRERRWSYTRIWLRILTADKDRGDRKYGPARQPAEISRCNFHFAPL